MDEYDALREKLEALAELACKGELECAARKEAEERMWALFGKLSHFELNEMAREDRNENLRMAAGRKLVWDVSSQQIQDVEKMRKLGVMERDETLHPSAREYARELREWMRNWFMERWNLLTDQDAPEGMRLAAGMEIIGNLEYNSYPSALEAISYNPDIPGKVREWAGIKAVEMHLAKGEQKDVFRMMHHRNTLESVSRFAMKRMEEWLGRARYEEFKCLDGERLVPGGAKKQADTEQKLARLLKNGR